MKSDQWSRGYYCAVSILLREEGIATTQVRSLFGQGGDWRKADPFDIALFKEYGLVTPLSDSQTEPIPESAGG